MVACTSGGILASAKVYPVKWFSGFTMTQWLVNKAFPQSQKDIKSLLDKSWEYRPVELVNTQTKQMLGASRCNQILPAITQLEPVRGIDTNPYAEQAVMCVATRAIASAHAAQYSALSTFTLDADFPLSAPKNLALMISYSEAKRVLQNKKIVNWAQAETVKFVSKEGEYQAKYDMEGAFQTVSLIARGDFNYDGIEDLLLFARSRVVDGTYASFRLFWLTKTDADSPLTLFKEYPPQDRECDWPAC